MLDYNKLLEIAKSKERDYNGGYISEYYKFNVIGSEALTENHINHRHHIIVTDHQREVLLLTYFHRFTYKEAAGILRVPVGTVKSRLHAAVARFAWEWKRRYDEPGEG